MDLQQLTYVAATRTEAGAARGRRSAVVGIGARKRLPAGDLVSFGLAGGLHDGLELGDVLDATRVVDTEGNVLWQGGPLGVEGARPGTIVAADRVVEDRAERLELHRRTGGDAVDMESAALARTGRLAGVLRAVSDTPSRGLGPLARALGDDGRLSPRGIAGMVAAPVETARALRSLRFALRRLGETLA